MNVSLTPELDKLVQEKVASGMYHSASEVIREALRLLIEQDRLREIRLMGLRQEIAVGLEQLERGEYTEHGTKSLRQAFDQVKSAGRRKLAGQAHRDVE